ncbi:class I SAM-dependent methyltransferase [Desulfohalobium retbaense]|uniref:Methyltransferase type 12 n=1 Tax=Desulfohalobium retbaense (strain ATCC 49708 / DSM 5692 / JCM 16813 / HR100) TaxID=485915 RepID=C8WYZ8_DESRD|nr:class I SAM-dependent methyltransferase [Desulfohalobium retbaense]ACV67914.1 Methyltransferase type 12 [Desulfohalobium retbaense DSM 5692]
MNVNWPTDGIFEKDGHRGKIFDVKDGFHVIDCESCGFKHIVPIPTIEELEEVYKHDYYSTEKPLYLERHQEDLDWWNTVYDQRYDFFENELPNERRNILDVGSGPGYFLLRGKQRGWHVEGIEPSGQAAEHSRSLGSKIYQDFLDQKSLPKFNQYDVIHASEVLEHIPDPEEMLKNMYQLLKPGGIICISVPNDYNPLQYALRVECGFDPWWVAPPHHINYFDFDSLTALLQKVGYNILRKEASFPMELFLLMGDNYIGNDSLGRECHTRRKNYEQTLVQSGLSQLKRQLEHFYSECNVGRTAIIYGVCQ